jgi:FkbM family methyltransferase
MTILRKIVGSLFDLLRGLKHTPLYRFKTLHKVYHRLYRLLTSIFRKEEVEVNGYRFKPGPEDALNLCFNEVFEPEETEFFKRMVQPGNSLIDLGANIGYFSCLFASLAGCEGRVFAIEPDPENIRLLEENKFINGFENIEIIQAAVSTAKGKQKLYLSNSVQNSLYKVSEDTPVIEVETIHLGQYYRERIRGRIDFLKTDMQGAEALLVGTIDEILRENHDIVIVSEFYPYGLSQLGRSAGEYLDYFISHGFGIAVYEGSREISEIGRQEALDRVTDKRFPDKYINVYFCRNFRSLQDKSVGAR